MRSLMVVLAVVTSVRAGAATIAVSVNAAGKSSVQNAVVYAVPAVPVPVGRAVAVMDQIDRTFVPHVLPVQTGTWVEFPNSDNVRHTVFSVSTPKRFQLPLYVGKPARPIQFDKAGVVALGCNIHEQMSAYIVVVDTPYFARTDDGRAKLADLPAGEYRLRVWHPGMKQEPAPQTVTIGADAHMSISFDVK